MTSLDTNPTRRAFDRRNPLARLACALIVAVPNLVSPSVGLALATVALAVLTALVATSLPGRVVLRVVAVSGLAGIGVGLANALGSAPTAGDSRLEIGVVTGLRLVAVIVPAVLAFATIDPVDAADSAVGQLRVPVRAAYGVVAALRLAPHLLADWQTLRDAERARGMAGVRWWLRRLAALLVSAIRRADRTAVALDARGFDTLPTTAAGRSDWTAADTAWVLGALVLTALGALGLTALR